MLGLSALEEMDKGNSITNKHPQSGTYPALTLAYISLSARVMAPSMNEVGEEDGDGEEGHMLRI